MHGELLKARCLACGAVTAWHDDLGGEESCPACSQKGQLRPHVVWFGEIPFHMDDIEVLLTAADLFVAIGTSGSIYPAAGFVRSFRGSGKPTCELNLEPSDNANLFTERHYGSATTVVPAWVDRVLAGNAPTKAGSQ